MEFQRFLASAQESQLFHKGEMTGLVHLSRLITARRPLIYWSMELYDKEENGIKGGGGLGILAADTRRDAEELGIPFVIVTPFYTRESHQRLNEFWQDEDSIEVQPSAEYRQFCTVDIKTSAHPIVPLNIYDRELGSTRLITVTEPNFGELYPGENNSDHRLYQEVALGFGGYKTLKMEGVEAGFMQLNEAPTVFAALARLDDLMSIGHSLDTALHELRQQTLYTNHTLVPAVEGEFNGDQFNHMVMPNITHEPLRQWVWKLFNEHGTIKLSLLAIELAGMKSGVSELHARVARFYDNEGSPVRFTAVTNGISQKWILPQIEQYYRELDIMRENNLPSDHYKQNLLRIDPGRIRQLRRAGRAEMNQVLARRKNQYGDARVIPEGAIVFDFKRRFASYKRPDMAFHDSERLADILENSNAYFLLTGKPHPNDQGMKEELQRILRLVDQHPILRQRVQYIQDYDEEVGRALAIGTDCAINVPIIGEEACGTSWMKDVANLKLLISTADGGVADVQPIACFEVDQNNESQSLYDNMERACRVLRDDDQLKAEIVRSLSAYLPIVSGSRMMAKYLQLFSQHGD